VPRKFGKTLLGAAILLYLLVEDGEGGSEVYTAASTRNQARLLWLPAKGMIANDRYLSSRLRVYHNSIARLDENGEPDGSFFQAISAEATSAHGFSPHAYAVDEVHAQKDGELMDVLDTGTAAREQPLELNFTTADYEGESPCNDLYAYAKQVRDGLTEGCDGKGDAEFLPVIVEIEEGEDWRDPVVWVRVNPHYPITPTESYMRSRVRRASSSPRYLNVILRLNFNKQTQADVQWFDLDVWDQSAGTVDPDALRGRPCYGGLDLSSKLDLTAFVLVFPEDGHAVLPFFWAPRATALRRDEKNIRPSYTRWAQDGHLTLCKGATIDQEAIRRKVVELSKLYDIRGIGIDRWQADKLAKELEETDGVCEFFPVGMGYASMSGPCKYLEQLVVDQAMAHGGHPVLRWNASTVMAKTDDSPAENIKPVKPTSRSGARRLDDNKIDGIVALAMGLAV
jgi:phage terminase large subunit-like protein